MAGLSGDLRKRFVVFAMAFLVLGVLAAFAAARTGPDQSRLILRLPDLGPGYMKTSIVEGQGERILCHPLNDPEDTPPRLERMILRYHPRGCIAAYYRTFEIPGEKATPLLIGTGAMAMANREAADAAWSLVPVLLGRYLNDHVPREVPSRLKIGQATRLFHGGELSPVYRTIGRKVSFLAWRSGNTLAVVMVFGKSFAATDAAARELAPRQQAHILKPTPYTGAERFDAEVPLDDPAIKVPVYWLGRNFSPGHGLEPERLASSSAPLGKGPESAERIRIGYDNGLSLRSWTSGNWVIDSHGTLPNEIVSWHCTEARTIPLAEGNATIYGGYVKDYKSCPSRPPDTFTARARLGGMLVAINLPDCIRCLEGSEYSSFPVMEAIVRGLKLRPPPVY